VPNRRHQIFIKGGDHRSLLVGAIVLILVLVVVASGLFYILANRNLEQATYRAHFEALRNTMQLLLPWLLIVNLIGLIVVIILALFFTHKIAGPVYHLIVDLKKLKDGDLTAQTVFRKGDRLKDVASAMSEAAEQLRLTVNDIKKGVAELSEVTGDERRVKEKLEDINRTLDKLKT
jgi:methyl-accepting chemotaxis protein